MPCRGCWFRPMDPVNFHLMVSQPDFKTVYFDLRYLSILLLGKVGVICAINGPMEVKYADEKLNKATIQTIFKPLEGLGGWFFFTLY